MRSQLCTGDSTHNMEMNSRAKCCNRSWRKQPASAANPSLLDVYVARPGLDSHIARGGLLQPDISAARGGDDPAPDAGAVNPAAAGANPCPALDRVQFNVAGAAFGLHFVSNARNLQASRPRAGAQWP